MSKTFKKHAVEGWFLGTSKNNYANSANSCYELEAFTGKRIKVIV